MTKGQTIMKRYIDCVNIFPTIIRLETLTVWHLAITLQFPTNELDRDKALICLMFLNAPKEQLLIKVNNQFDPPKSVLCNHCVGELLFRRQLKVFETFIEVKCPILLPP